MRAQLGKFAFAKMGKALKKLFAGNHGEHGIAQKLQLFVITDLIFAFPGLLRFLFARLGTMGESLLHHRPAVKVVVQSRFQCGDFPFFHAGSNTGPRVLQHRFVNNQGSVAKPYFGAGFCPGAVPLLSRVRRSFSSRAAFPAGVPSFVKSTAWFAYFRASAYLFCWSSANESRSTATGSTCCGNASMDLRRSASASVHALALYSIAPMTEYASDFRNAL